MKLAITCAAFVAALVGPTVASAQDAAAPSSAAVSRGATLYSADGKRLGKIYDVNNAKDGTPSSVSVILGYRLVHVPFATLSTGEKGVTTSLTRAQVGKGK